MLFDKHRNLFIYLLVYVELRSQFYAEQKTSSESNLQNTEILSRELNAITNFDLI